MHHFFGCLFAALFSGNVFAANFSELWEAARNLKVDDQFKKNMRSHTEEALTVALMQESIRTPVDASTIAKAAMDFGQEMADLYQGCYLPPRCSESSLGAYRGEAPPRNYFGKVIQGNVREANDEGYCYPNTAFDETLPDGSVLRRQGAWVTGDSHTLDWKHQEQARLGAPIAKEYYEFDEGVKNSARHAYLFCYIAGLNGYARTKYFADWHEHYHRESGLEDAWADYWNNEIGMRFGHRLHRILFTLDPKRSAFNVTYRRQLEHGISRYHAGTGRGAGPDESADIIDLAGIDFRRATKHSLTSANGFVAHACKRYLEGVIVGQVKEAVDAEGGRRLEPVRLMNHRPSLAGRLDTRDFFPVLGRPFTAPVAFLAGPAAYGLPVVNQGGLPWVNAAPRAGDAKCLADARANARYWTNNPRTLPWTEGDSDLYWPHYREDRDRFQPFVRRSVR